MGSSFIRYRFTAFNVFDTSLEVYPPFFKEKIKEFKKIPSWCLSLKGKLELKYEKSGQMGAREEHKDQSEQDESEH